MKNISMVIGAALVASTALAAPAAAQMNAQFYTVPQDNRDFGGQRVTGVIANAVQDHLGPTDRPIANANLNAQDVDPVTGELLWWQPGNLASSFVTSTNSYSNDNFYPDNTATNTGSDQNGFFRTAIFSGTFSTLAPGSYSFSLGSDDDAYLFVDDNLVAQLGGVHSAATTSYDVDLTEGQHGFQLFYADRQPTGAVLNFALPANVTSTTAVPEPASWAMLIVGFGLMGASLRYRRRKSAVSFA